MNFRARQRRGTFRDILVALLIIAGCARPSPEERAFATALRLSREQKDAYMRSLDGPLTDDQRAVFHGLKYFPARLDFVFEVPVEPAALDTVRFLTSTNTVEPYLRFGTLRFQHQGRSYALTLYRSLDGHLFLPFTDATSGHETYGAGRYVEPEPLPGERYRLDFNHAYNPYCAYNSHWTCPIAPAENHLALRVEAGEKSFHD